MSALAVAPAPLPPALPGPYADPPDADRLEPHPATVGLVRGVVRDLLLDTRASHALSADEQDGAREPVVRVGSYLAECVARRLVPVGRLDQRPMIRARAGGGPLAEAQQRRGTRRRFRPWAATGGGADSGRRASAASVVATRCRS